MAKAEKPPRSPASKATAEVGASETKTPRRKSDGTRETIESIIVAFILAFLFRTFEAEAFVIPTGSMAPTLLGRHKDVECVECGHGFTIGASDEVDDDSGVLLPNKRVETAICPNCRYEMPVESLPVFKGDRILVNKYPYEFGDPQRWDVVVFKYPEEPSKNYIKRLVGLPGETIQIRQGDVYAKQNGESTILRKQDPNKQRELQIVVYDNDHPARDLLEAGWPERWAAVEPDASSKTGWIDAKEGWTADPQARTFSLEAAGTEDAKYRHLRYRHLVPGPEVWKALAEGRRLPAPEPQLITDFCGYNAYTGGDMASTVDYGLYWVGDLTLRFEVDVEDVGETGELLLELNEGARQYRCRINLTDGTATLFYPDSLDHDGAQEIVLATAATAVQGAGRYKISFANVDDRLSLWINDRLVDFGGTTEYEPYGGLQYQPPTNADLAPVGIAAQDADVTVSHLRVERDIYYRAEIMHPDDEPRNPHESRTIHETDFDPRDGGLRDAGTLATDPEAWFQQYRDHLSANDPRYADVAFSFALADDEFLMLGDNSPRSRDSRVWPNYYRRAEHRHAVPRSLLVGKAFFVYWPHGVPFLNDGHGIPVRYHTAYDPEERRLKRTDYPSFRVPFYPQVGRMERIR